MLNMGKLAVAAVMLELAAGIGGAATVTWTQLSGGNGSGSWSVAANPPWSSGALPGSTDVVDFSASDITADSTITLDGDQNINSLIFGDTVTSSAAGWTVSAGSPTTSKLILNGTTPTITVNTLGTGKSVTISAVIDGASGLNKAGTGTLVLSGANTFSNAAINAGTLKFSQGGSPPVMMKGALTVNSGGTLAFGNYNQFNEQGYVPVTVCAGGVVDSSGTVTTFRDLTLAGGNMLSKGGFNLQWSSFVVIGTLKVTTNSSILSISGGNNGLTPGAHTGHRTLVINVSAGVTLVEDLPIRDSPIDAGTSTNFYSFVLTGPGTAVFGGTSVYSGGTTISNGFIAISNNSALGVGPVTLAGGGLSAAAGSWTITNTINLATNAVINTAGNDLTLAAAVTNSGSLIKAGLGTLTLLATNTYSGVTVVTNGVLTLKHETCLSTNTDVYLYSGATNNLDFTGTNTINRLYINGTYQTLDIYGAANRPSVLSGTGFLKPLLGAPVSGTVVSVR